MTAYIIRDWIVHLHQAASLEPLVFIGTTRLEPRTPEYFSTKADSYRTWDDQASARENLRAFIDFVAH